MFCRRCYYDLRVTSEPVCPECGQSFDPDDVDTYWPYTIKPWTLYALKAFAAFDRWPVCALGILFFTTGATFAPGWWNKGFFIFMIVLQIWNGYRTFRHGSDFAKAIENAKSDVNHDVTKGTKQDS